MDEFQSDKRNKHTHATKAPLLFVSGWIFSNLRGLVELERHETDGGKGGEGLQVKDLVFLFLLFFPHHQTRNASSAVGKLFRSQDLHREVHTTTMTMFQVLLS